MLRNFTQIDYFEKMQARRLIFEMNFKLDHDQNKRDQIVIGSKR